MVKGVMTEVVKESERDAGLQHNKFKRRVKTVFKFEM